MRDCHISFETEQGAKSAYEAYVCTIRRESTGKKVLNSSSDI